MMEIKKKRNSGFTLIELIIVIAILGILALIAIPRLGGYRQSAGVAADRATAKIVADAISLAIATNEIVPIDGGTFEIKTHTLNPGSYTPADVNKVLNLIQGGLNGIELSDQNPTVVLTTTGDGTVINPLELSSPTPTPGSGGPTPTSGPTPTPTSGPTPTPTSGPTPTPTSLPAMGGSVGISGTTKYSQVLVANISGITYSPTTTSDVPTYQWNRGGTPISGATNTTYTLVQADIGQTITVTVIADGTHATGFVTSAVTSVIAKADGPAAPAAPTLASRTDTSITLVAVAGQEYRLGTGGTWQTSNTFTGLTTNTSYTLYARIAATATINESSASSGLSVTTTQDQIDCNNAASAFSLTLSSSSPYTVTTLSATGANSTSITWTYNGNAVASRNGTTLNVASRPGSGSLTSTITATFSKGSATATASWVLTVPSSTSNPRTLVKQP